MKLLGTIGAGLVALGLSFGAAVAGPMTPPSKADLAVDNMIDKVHARHDRCAWSDRDGWHRSPYGGVRACRPNRPGAAFIWQCGGGNCGWWHPRQRYYHHHRNPGLYFRF